MKVSGDYRAYSTQTDTANEAQALCNRDILGHCLIAAFAQTDEPNTAPTTIGDVQKLVDTISGDKAKLKAFSELGTLYEQIEKAEEKNDAKEVDASLEQQVGPDYRRMLKIRHPARRPSKRDRD